MRFIPTALHGLGDYVMGAVLIAAPWLFGFAEGGPEQWGAATWVPIIVGAATILQSLMTAYELGLVSLISMKAHLTIDIFAGLLLAASPWLFGFSEHVWVPHLVFGLAEVGAGLFTKTTPTRVPQGQPSQHAPG